MKTRKSEREGGKGESEQLRDRQGSVRASEGEYRWELERVGGLGREGSVRGREGKEGRGA